MLNQIWVRRTAGSRQPTYGEIVIHIGMQKTGSTALEQAFASSRPVLAEAGIDYPFSGNAHHELAWAAQHRTQKVKSPEQYLEKARSRLAEATVHTVVLSSEEFCGLQEAQIATLASILPPDRRVRIVCYIRDQIDWIEAMMNQKIKSSAERSITRAFKRFLPKTDYFSMLQRWQRQFGREALEVRIYRSGLDTVSDMLTVLGCATLPVNRQNDPTNVSLSAPLISMKQIANTYGHSRAMRGLLNEIQLRASPGARSNLISAADKERIIATAEQSNISLWRHFNLEDEPFDLRASARKHEQKQDLSTDELFRIFAYALALQQRQIDELKRQVQDSRSEDRKHRP